MSRLLRNIGNLANTFLQDQIQRDDQEYKSGLDKQRQEEVYRHNIADKVITNLAPRLASGEIAPEDIAGFDQMPQELQAVLRSHASTAPSAEQRGQAALGDTLKNIGSAKSMEDLGAEDTSIASGKAALEKARVPMGSGDDNPIWGVQDAYDAQKTQIGLNQEASMDRTRAADQEKYDREHPEEKVVFQSIDANGKPSGDLLVQDPNAPGGYRKATTADKLKKDAVHYIEGRESAYYGTTAGGGPMDDATVDMYARQVAKGGPLPTFYGANGNTDKRRIANRASTWNAATDQFDSPKGTTPDLVGNRIDVSAGKGSIEQLTKNINAVGAFKKTADMNSALLKKTMANIPSQNMPTFISSRIRDLAQSFGDPSLAAFEAARQSVSTEYGRLIRQPSLTGVFTNDAQQKIDAAMKPDSTVGQILAAVDILQQESANRETGFKQQLEEARHSLPGGNVQRPGGGAPALPAGVTIRRRQ